MTTVDVRTGAIVEITYQEVRESVDAARAHGGKFFEEIVWQVQNRTWTLLGHASWDVMRDVEYGDMGVVVPRADRPELVARLRAEGLSQQQIGDTLGVAETTVRRDLVNRQMADEDKAPPATRTNIRGQQRPTQYARPPEPPPFLPPARAKTREEIDAEDREQTIRETAARIAECVFFLEGGRESAQTFLTHVYPHESRVLPDGMRLSRERVDSAMAFLATIREELDR